MHTPNQRSSRWFARRDEMGLRHRAAVAVLGYDPAELMEKPVIGICNPDSDFSPCELGFREILPALKRGIIAAGGIPLEFPTMTLGADLLKPADMLYRNLVSMDIEESIRGYPMDGVVLLANCDKTTPAQLMAAASADLPALQFSAGPRPVAFFRGEAISTGTDLWKYWDEYRSGQLDDAGWRQFEACLACSHGACNEMGTTSTMTGLSEALGMMPWGTSSIPSDDPARLAAAEAAGHTIVARVKADLRPSALMTPGAFDNAIRLLGAIGGSTNAIVHLIAIAGRRRIRLPLSRFDELSQQTPLLLNLKPSGRYLLAEFHAAGGVPAVLEALRPHLDLDSRMTPDATLGELLNHTPAQVSDPELAADVLRTLDAPLQSGGALVTVTGNLVPSGAIIKASAASPDLMEHTGPAFVFDDYEEMMAQSNDPDLPVTPDSVIVLRNAGPCGVPGMPEWGQLPIPLKLLKAGIKDVVRISDARMSGTSYGTVVLHAAPESAVGGPLALVQTGDLIRLDVPNRRLDLLVEEDELARRRAAWSPPPRRHLRGYPRLYVDHVLQADEGCDFDFLRPQDEAEMEFVEPQIGRS